MEREKALEWFLAYLRKKKDKPALSEFFWRQENNKILGLKVTNKFTFILKTLSHHPIKSSG